MSSALMYACVVVLGQAGGTAPASGGAAESSSRSLLEWINSGGFVAYVLVLLSVIGVALIIMNFIVLRRSYLAPPRVVEGLDRLVRDKQIDLAIQYCKAPENDSFLSRVMSAALTKSARSQFGMLELKPALEEAAARELDKLDRVTHALRVVADLGPMLGLLGTVIGILRAFHTLESAGGAAHSNRLMGNMSEALVNTAIGLTVAIIGLVFHAMFKRHTDRLVAEVGDIAEHFAAVLQGPAGASAQPKPAAQQGSRPQPAPVRSASTGIAP